MGREARANKSEQFAAAHSFKKPEPIRNVRYSKSVAILGSIAGQLSGDELITALMRQHRRKASRKGWVR